MSTSTDNWEEVEATAKRVLGDEIAAFIGQCRSQTEPESQLVAVLHKVQARFGYLAEAHLDAVAWPR
jgi:NADH:ubiquinone oxidoreductase subunit E